MDMYLNENISSCVWVNQITCIPVGGQFHSCFLTQKKVSKLYLNKYIECKAIKVLRLYFCLADQKRNIQFHGLIATA